MSKPTYTNPVLEQVLGALSPAEVVRIVTEQFHEDLNRATVKSTEQESRDGFVSGRMVPVEVDTAKR